MPAKFENPLRRKWRAGQSAYGLWVTMESATLTELAADAGIDWVLIDMEHGSLSYRDVVDHLRAARGTDVAVLVRVSTAAIDTIKRALDLGAHGVLLPLIATADELQSAFSHARYPIQGKRGLGGERAIRWGAEMASYVAAANEETLVIPVIETQTAFENIDSILDVPGLEAVFYGPSDFSQSRGHMAVWEGPGIAEDILVMADKAKQRGIINGVIATDDANITLRKNQGFRMIGIGTDTSLLRRTMLTSLKQCHS
jgi:2-keto-3-deoxy-L-rhamnonate aldolase RhmA